jgi:hypothetical protein
MGVTPVAEISRFLDMQVIRADGLHSSEYYGERAGSSTQWTVGPFAHLVRPEFNVQVKEKQTSAFLRPQLRFHC